VRAAGPCIADDSNIVRLDDVVAPALYALGLHPTGTIETARTEELGYWCGHYYLTLLTSWDLARRLTSMYGWSFASHSATYPNDTDHWIALGVSGPYDQTCASERQISSEGLPGAAGLFAWPRNFVYAPAMPDVQACFDFNRLYTKSGITDQATATQPPYVEPAKEIKGGPCNDRGAPCYTYSFPLAGGRYTLPAELAAIIASASQSQWVTIQSYLFVTGYQSGHWDCTSPDPQEHWTYDTERYCWNDCLAVVSSLPLNVTVTDPASVGAAWGRTVTSPSGPATSIVLGPATATIPAGATQAFEAEGYNATGDDIGEVTTETIFTISGSGTCRVNACGATQPGTYQVTGHLGNAADTAQLNVLAACPSGECALGRRSGHGRRGGPGRPELSGTPRRGGPRP
jgi:hypothetical protein